MALRIRYFGIFCILLLLVLISNHAYISFNMMYPEQPTIYLANKTITHFRDLLAIYLHPTFLHASIPFFRPSGHFLIYQIMAPILGWHNNQAFIIVNFIFLAMTGYFLIRLYQLLFPPYQYGGWLAFGVYMMHPALSLSKLTLMHFEFAYVAFVIWSLYLFVQYCQLNKKIYLSLSLLLYIIAVTFKEPALMLGPVMAVYFLLDQYQHESAGKFIKEMIFKPRARNTLTALVILSLLLVLYILSSWPDIQYGNKTINITRTLGTANAFLTDALGLRHSYISGGFLAFPKLSWRTIVFPETARWLIWLLLAATCISSYLVYRSDNVSYKKSLIFIFTASMLYLILPLGWGMAGPWHYSLTLLMLSLAMGFSIDYLCHYNPALSANKKPLFITLGIILVSLTIQVNQLNIQKYLQLKNGPLALALNRNAIFNPPDIKSQLNDQSLIVVEDSIMQNDYMIGNAAFPFLLVVQEGDYDSIAAEQKAYMMKFDYTYGGTLFRYAYNIPSLKEEVYPFKIEKMNDVPNEMIYTWLKQGTNIFAVGYDAAGNWHDKTKEFRSMLTAIEKDRQLIYNQYQHYLDQQIKGKSSYAKEILFPDPQLCSYTCDQDKQCVGFTLSDMKNEDHHTIRCEFYRQGNKITLGDAEKSDVYIKEKTSAQQFNNPYSISPSTHT